MTVAARASHSRGADKPLGADIDVVEKLLTRRSSCRGFLPDELPRETIVRLLAAAQRTASWCNSQPWQVTITSGAATAAFREALHAYAASKPPAAPDIPFPSAYVGVYRDRRRDSGFRLYNAVGLERGDEIGRARQSLENFRMFGAPHAAIITSDPALGPYGAVDCGGYVANFLIAAEALGIATVPQAALAYYSDFVRNHLAIPADRHVVCGISFGLADPDHPANGARMPRASLEEAVTWKG